MALRILRTGVLSAACAYFAQSRRMRLDLASSIHSDNGRTYATNATNASSTEGLGAGLGASSGQCHIPASEDCGGTPQSGWCGESQDNCEGNCGGKWCTSGGGSSPTPPSPTPSNQTTPTSATSTPSNSTTSNSTPSNSTGSYAYCLAESDLNTDYGSPEFITGGWKITGGARVSSKAAFNLIGGGLEFDMTVDGAQEGVNQNFYTISPEQVSSTGEHAYCDGQGEQNGNPFCIEMDIIESNGQCAAATTWHTVYGWDGGCDQAGCGADVKLSSTALHVVATFDSSGTPTVTINGEANSDFNRQISSSDLAIVKSTFEKTGAVFASSQWTGWVPAPSGCSGDNCDSCLASSYFSITNVKVQGTVVQGPTPTSC